MNVDQLTHLLRNNDVNARDKYDKTPLMRAVESANPEVIRVLLDAGAYVNTLDEYGKTAWDSIQSNESLKGTDVYWKLYELRF